MNTKLCLILVPAAAFLMGASYAAGKFFADPIIAEQAGPAATQIVTVRDGADATALNKALSELEALRTENASLRKALDAAEQEAVQPPPEERERPQRRQRMSWQARMEELKKTNPERYNEEMARRESFQKAIEERRNQRNSFLGSIDTTLLSQEGQEIHERYTAALAGADAIGEQLRTLMESGEEPSEELRETMRSTMQTLMETREAERENLLTAVATSMGLSADESEGFAELIAEIVSATGGMGPGGPGPMRGPGGRGEPGAR